MHESFLGRWVPTWRATLTRGAELHGKALKNWVGHERHAHDAFTGAYAPLSHWRLAGGTEVDSIVNDMEVVVEAKAVSRIAMDHLKGHRALVQDHPEVKQRITACLEPRARRTEDGS